MYGAQARAALGQLAMSVKSGRQPADSTCIFIHTYIHTYIHA